MSMKEEDSKFCIQAFMHFSVRVIILYYSFYTSCFFDNSIMLLTFVAIPIVMIAILISFLMTVVIIKINCDQTSPSVYSDQYSSIFGIIGLMGIFLAEITFVCLYFYSGQSFTKDLVIEVLFSISCIIFGLYAFVFHVLLSKDAKESWKEFFRCSMFKKHTISSNKDNNDIIIVETMDCSFTQNTQSRDQTSCKNKSIIKVASDHFYEELPNVNARGSGNNPTTQVVSIHVVRLDSHEDTTPACSTMVTVKTDNEYETINERML